MKQMTRLIQLAVTLRITTLDFHKNAKKTKAATTRVGLHYEKLWRHPAVHFIPQIAHKHLHTVVCSEQEVVCSCTPTYLDLGLRAIHTHRHRKPLHRGPYQFWVFCKHFAC